MPFKMQGEPPEKKRFKPACVANIDLDANKWSWLSKAIVPPAPNAVMCDFDWSCSSWMCVDVETHDLAPRSHEHGWVDGTFGHKRLKYDDALVRRLRAIQLGWTAGDISSGQPPVTKTRLVKPSGFVITEAATEIHSIKHVDAVDGGCDLSEVLAEFLGDVQNLVRAGGRVCAHQLEFDAAIIDAELGRCEAGVELKQVWREAARGGLCTMNPVLTAWCCESYRRTVDRYGDGEKNRDMPCALGAVAWTLVPPCQELRAKDHDAGNDSCVGWLVVSRLHRHVRSAFAAPV